MLSSLRLVVVCLMGFALALKINSQRDETVISSQNVFLERSPHHSEDAKAYVHFLKTLDAPLCVVSDIKRLESRYISEPTQFYIMCVSDPENRSIKSIRIYEDTTQFDLVMVIPMEKINKPSDFGSSFMVKHLYVADMDSFCVWKISLEDHKVTKWLTDVGSYFTLSVSSDDEVLLLRNDVLEIYGSDANLRRRIKFSSTFSYLFEVIPKPNEQFIIVHEPNIKGTEFLVVIFSLVTAYGQIISEVHFTANFSDSGALCWLLYTDPHQVNDICLDEYSKTIVDPTVDDIYMIVEGEIVILTSNRHAGGSRNRKRVLLDVQLEFGTDSYKNIVAIVTPSTAQPLPLHYNQDPRFPEGQPSS